MNTKYDNLPFMLIQFNHVEIAIMAIKHVEIFL